MKAALITSFGGVENIQFHDRENPSYGVNEVVVKVKAVSLNPLDIKIMAGYMESVFPVEMPYIPGTDFSGVIEQVAEGVVSLTPGDRVVGRTTPQAGGALAGNVVISSSDIVKIPDEMSFEQAAAVPTAFGTAYQALFDSGKLVAGQRVLIHAGAGGVGSFAIQLAKQCGAWVITTVSEKNVELAKSLGADEVINYRKQNFTLTSPVDVILDTVGGETLEKSWKVLKVGGRIASLTDFAITNRDGKYGEFVFFSDAHPGLCKATDNFSAGRLQMVTDSIHMLENSRVALERVASGHACGKVIIRTGL